jgi:hypothetical protein
MERGNFGDRDRDGRTLSNLFVKWQSDKIIDLVLA